MKSAYTFMVLLVFTFVVLLTFLLNEAYGSEICGLGYRPNVIYDPYLQSVGSAHIDLWMIRINPQVMSQFPPVAQHFWFEHECAHLVVGDSEIKADCRATKVLVYTGILTKDNLQQLMDSISVLPGSKDHPPGRVRAEHIKQCATTDPIPKNDQLLVKFMK